MLTLEIPGYVPPSQNALRGRHWSVLAKEKRRAALALRDAFWFVSEFSQFDRWIGTITASKTFKTSCASLVTYLQTTGMYLKEASSLKRHTLKRKKKR